MDLVSLFTMNQIGNGFYLSGLDVFVSITRLVFLEMRDAMCDVSKLTAINFQLQGPRKVLIDSTASLLKATARKHPSSSSSSARNCPHPRV